eukprot:1711375-Rhodomonas_salina.1
MRVATGVGSACPPPCQTQRRHAVVLAACASPPSLRARSSGPALTPARWYPAMLLPLSFFPQSRPSSSQHLRSFPRHLSPCFSHVALCFCPRALATLLPAPPPPHPPPLPGHAMTPLTSGWAARAAHSRGDSAVLTSAFQSSIPACSPGRIGLYACC